MARLILSAVGTAIAGPIGGFIGGTIGGLIDNQLFPTHGPKMKELRVNRSAYGDSIPLLYGPENRVAGALIAKSALQRKKHKHLKGPITYTHKVDVAFLLSAGQMSGIGKLWANGAAIFDVANLVGAPTAGAGGSLVYGLANGTHEKFESLAFYPGSTTQPVDPTIESIKGIGNAHAYRGRCYIVIKGLKVDEWGALPNIEALVQAHAAPISVKSVVLDICSRCSLPPLTVSTSLLRGAVRGYAIAGQTNGLDALDPLALVYAFSAAEVAGQLRLTPRGKAPMATIRLSDLAGRDGNAVADSDTAPYQLTRRRETKLPKAAKLTFFDPARDYQTNTQGDTRSQGTADSIISSAVPIVLTEDEARPVADRVLWENQHSRDGYNATTDERLNWLEPGRAYGIQGPVGTEGVRIVRKTRGANRVVEFEAIKDRQTVYASSAVGTGGAAIPSNPVLISGPANPPTFIEIPPELANGVPQLGIAVSGGDGTTYDPNWRSGSIYISTDDASFEPAGNVTGPAIMGKLTVALPAYASANPDTVNTISVDFATSGGELDPVAADVAARFESLLYIGGEFVAYQDAAATGGFGFDLTTNYRGLYRTSAGLHAIGADVVRLDAAVFRLDLPANLVGEVLYVRIVGEGESLDDVPSYTFTPTGSQAACGPPSAVAISFASRTQTDGTSIIKGTITWAASVGPMVSHYEVELSTDNGVTWAALAAVGPASISATFEPALAATNYKPRVRAISSAPMIAPSAYATTAQVNSGALAAAPSAPTSLVVTAGDLSNKVAWTASATPGATYEVWAIHGSSGVFGSAVKIGTAPASPWIHAGLAASDTWRYWVVAVNAGGSSTELGPANRTTNASTAVVYSTTYFGSGAPSTLHTNGDEYFDTATTPYTGYVQNAGAWVLASSPGIVAKNEGSTLTSLLASLDFVGAGVDATNSGGAVTVTIPGGSTAYFGTGAPSTLHADGDLYFDTTSSTYVAYVQRSSAWHLASSASSGVPCQVSAPSSPNDGDLWWDATAGVLKIRYNDGSSTQWVDAFVAKGPKGDTGAQGVTGATGGTQAIDFALQALCGGL